MVTFVSVHRKLLTGKKREKVITDSPPLPRTLPILLSSQRTHSRRATRISNMFFFRVIQKTHCRVFEIPTVTRADKRSPQDKFREEV